MSVGTVDGEGGDLDFLLEGLVKTVGLVVFEEIRIMGPGG